MRGVGFGTGGSLFAAEPLIAKLFRWRVVYEQLAPETRQERASKQIRFSTQELKATKPCKQLDADCTP